MNGFSEEQMNFRFIVYKKKFSATVMMIVMDLTVKS